MVEDGFPDADTVIGTEGDLAEPFGVGHEPEDVALLVANPGDILQGAVGIGRFGRLAGLIAITDQDPPLVMEAPEPLGIDEVVPLAMRDGDLDDLPGL
jgi:hypothetical protein